MCAIRHCNSMWYENLSIGVNLWITIIVVGANLIGTLHYSMLLCIMWQIFCDILHVRVILLICEKFLRY